MTPAQKMIREIVDETNPFRDHVIEVKHMDGLYRRWRCGKPQSSTYYFDVITWPGWIAVTGDVGELMVSRVSDMLPWVRRSIGSISYFAEKVPNAIETKEYSPDKAEKLLQDEIDATEKALQETEQCSNCSGAGVVLIDDGEQEKPDKCDYCDGRGHNYAIDPNGEVSKECREKLDRLKELQSRVISGISEGEVISEWVDIFEGDTEVNFRDYNSNFLWCRECLIWFITHLKEEEASCPSVSNASEPKDGKLQETPSTLVDQQSGATHTSQKVAFLCIGVLLCIACLSIILRFFNLL